MNSSVVALVLFLSFLALSKGLTKESEKEFASGLLRVLEMDRVPIISTHRHDIPRYVLNLYRGKFAKLSDVSKSPSLGSTTRIYFPQGNTARYGKSFKAFKALMDCNNLHGVPAILFFDNMS